MMTCTICKEAVKNSADNALDLCERCYSALHDSYNFDPMRWHEAQNNMQPGAWESEDEAC